MNVIEEQTVRKALDRVLDDHVAQTRTQRNTLRELILDAIEQAGFDIVGRNPTIPQEAHDDAAKRAERWQEKLKSTMQRQTYLTSPLP